VLAALAEFGPVSQAELGRRAQMDRSDVTAAAGERATLAALLTRLLAHHGSETAASAVTVG
jgi:hypothetical protein